MKLTGLHPDRASSRWFIALVLAATAVLVAAPDGPWPAVALLVLVPTAASLLPGPRWFMSRVLVVFALLLAPVPLVLLVFPGFGGSGSARVAAALAALVVVGLHLAAEGRPKALSRVRPGDGLFPILGLSGVVLIANTYLLRGSSGFIGLMDHDHVFHAAAITSAWTAGMAPDTWSQVTAKEVLAVPAAIHWSIASWVTRFIPDPMSLDPMALVRIHMVIAAAASCLGWLGALSAVRVVAGAVPAPRAWTCAAVISLLLGPVLWLRYAGMWPALLAAGYLALASAYGSAVLDARGVRSRSSGPALVMAGACAGIGIQAWPLLALPVLAVVVVLAVVMHRRGAMRALVVAILEIGIVTVLVGVAWAASTVRRSFDTLAGGAGGLGLPDWRLGALVVASVVLLTSLRRLPQPVPPPPSIAALLAMAAAVAGYGLVLDYWFSLTAAAGSSYYAGKLSVIAGILAAPAVAIWVSTALRGSEGGARTAWAATCAAVCAFCAAIWLPWDGDYYPYGSVGLAPGVPAVLTTMVGDRALATDRAALDSAVLGCGIDGVIRWPGESTRAGAFRYASMWTAVAGGRLDPAGWAAAQDAFPAFPSGADVGQQLASFGAGGKSPRTVAWVVPDRDAFLLGERISITRLPEGVRVRVFGETQFSDELARCGG